MIIVGLCGHKRSGKGETALILERRFGFTHYGFADALRTMAAAIDPMISIVDAPPDIHELLAYGPPGSWWMARYTHIVATIGYERAKEIPDFRRFLQRFGTEAIRTTFGANAWVELLARRAETENVHRLVISDVRFHSEVEWIRAKRGMLWCVTRRSVVPNDPHVSENQMLELQHDHVICNDYALVDLEETVCDAVEVAVRCAWSAAAMRG